MSSAIYLIVGPSGVGKTTVTERLSKLYGYRCVESYTDRAPRYEGETGHIFVSTEEFNRIAEEEGMVAYTMYDGHQYGVTSRVIDESDLYVIDPAGVIYFLERYHGQKKPYVIRLYQDEEVLVGRMKKRGDSEEKIRRRLTQDRESFDFEKYPVPFDLQIKTDDTDTVVNTIYSFIFETSKNL